MAREISKKWLAEVGITDSELLRDIHECAQEFSSQTTDIQDKTQWLLQSDEARRFLSSPSSQVLLVDAETLPDELMNPLSFASAFLAQTLSAATASPTLVYMCGIRQNESSVPEDQNSPLAMLTSLNAQLLKYIAESKPGVDLSFLDEKKQRRKHQKKLSASLRLLQRLLDSFSSREVVFIIIDSCLSLSGPQDEAEDCIRSLLDIADQAQPVSRVLLSGLAPPFLASLETGGYPTLYLPDYIDGDRQGVDAELLGEESQLSIEEFRSSQRRVSSGYEDTSSEDSDSDLSED